MDLFHIGSGFLWGRFQSVKAITKLLLNRGNLLSFLPDTGRCHHGVSGRRTHCNYFYGETMKSLMVGRPKIFCTAVSVRAHCGIASGTVITVLVQSSSTTTSLIVPLVGNNVLTHRDIYPFVLGANIGTCITAMLAALAVTGENAGFALQIALVHLMYNVLGVTVIYGKFCESCRYSSLINCLRKSQSKNFGDWPTSLVCSL